MCSERAIGKISKWKYFAKMIWMDLIFTFFPPALLHSVIPIVKKCTSILSRTKHIYNILDESRYIRNIAKILLNIMKLPFSKSKRIGYWQFCMLNLLWPYKNCALWTKKITWDHHVQFSIAGKENEFHYDDITYPRSPNKWRAYININSNKNREELLVKMEA